MLPLFENSKTKVLHYTTGFPNWRNGEKSLQLNSDPGAHFSYSGEGFVLLQKVIEHVSKQTMQAFVALRVFVPLGMTASSFVWRENYAAELAEAHGPLGELEERPRMTEGNAAFSLYTTAKDYGVFLAAMLNQQILPRNSFAQMLKPQVQLPARWGDRSGQKAEGFYWGLGWGLQRTKMSESFWHWGDNGPYKCYVVGYPEQKRGLVFFTNSAHGLELASELVWRLWRDDQAALLQWLGYEAYNSASAILAQTARKKGVSAALAQFHELRQANSSYHLNESAVNELGYLMMRMHRMEDALQLFQLNVESFPASWNVYDSYAEAQLRNGNRELAAENYAKSLALNANNSGAKQILSQLRPAKSRLGNAHFTLKGYAQARLVILAGSFNDWSDLHTLLVKEGEEWTCHLELPAGKHFYKFVVDGKWIVDPDNPHAENDGDGNANSVLIVE
ncbi:serine hydrolase [candidate division KSB1 bacterium]|nr:serine hydrolase [candidate division KSB1 bacterium]